MKLLPLLESAQIRKPAVVTGVKPVVHAVVELANLPRPVVEHRLGCEKLSGLLLQKVEAILIKRSPNLRLEDFDLANDGIDGVDEFRGLQPFVGINVLDRTRTTFRHWRRRGLFFASCSHHEAKETDEGWKK